MAPRLRPHEAPLPTDTSPEAAAVQERLFRVMGPAGRMRAALELSEAVIEEVRRSLERLHPGATRREIDLAFIGTCHGADLAREVARHLRDRDLRSSGGTMGNHETPE